MPDDVQNACWFKTWTCSYTEQW